jgi:hypothetical protein
MTPSVIGNNNPRSDSQLVSVRMPGNTSQGSVSRSKLFSLLFEISLFFFLV